MNIISLRPKIGVGSQNYFKIIGKRVKRNISKDDPIFFKDLKKISKLQKVTRTKSF